MSDEFYGFDDDDFDGCEHGVGFDEDCEDCEDDPIGCVFPGRCLMPGVHLESECHTVEMMEVYCEGGKRVMLKYPDGWWRPYNHTDAMKMQSVTMLCAPPYPALTILPSGDAR